MPVLSTPPAHRPGHALRTAVLLLSVSMLPGLAGMPSPAIAQTTVRSYDIPAGPLGPTLSRFALDQGLALSFEPALTQGLRSPGLQGSFTPGAAADALLAGSGLRLAQRADGTYTLERIPSGTGPSAVAALSPVRVVGHYAPTTEGTGSYTSDAISVFKGSQSIRETPQPVTVLSRQLLTDRKMSDLHDVLQNTPGVTVDYTDSERVQYFSRGHAIDTVQFDGMTTALGGSAFAQPDTAVLDRVEIVRGSGGLLRGSGNPSATVNLVRKRPTRDFQASGAVTLGTWDRRRVEADISTPLVESGAIRARLVAVSDRKDFFQKARHEQREVLYGILEADLTPDTVVSAGFQHTDLDATGAWGNLPVGLDGSPLDFPRDTYLGAHWNQWNRWNQQAFADIEHRFDNEWRVKLSGSHTRYRMKDQGFKQSYMSRPSGATNPYLFNVSASIYTGDATDQSVLNLTSDGPFTLFGRRHELVLGAEASRTKVTPTRGLGGLNPMVVDIRDWDPYTSMPEPFADLSGVPLANDNVTRQQGVYATTRLSLADPLTAIVGARASWWDYEVPNQASSNYAIEREITPYAGLVFDMTRDLSLYASYTEIFTPQNAKDRDGKIIAPIRGEDYEVGVKGEFFDGRLNASLSGFRINNVGRAIEDASTPNPCVPHYLTGYCRMPGGKTRSQGWEVELAGEILPNWHVFGGYSNTLTKTVRDASVANIGQPLRTRDPRHLARLFTTYRLSGALSGLTLGGGVQAQSSVYATSGRLVARQSGYAIYNAMLRYDVNRHVSVQLNVNNLFDKVYYRRTDAGGIGNYYGDPRHFLLSLEARL